jgi:hypothetical protein
MKPNKLATRFRKITLAGILFVQIILFSGFSFNMINIPTRQSNFRKVLLFAPTVYNAHLLKQQAIFESDTEGLKERDLKVSSIIYSPDQKSLFKRYNVSATQFTFILIGKDGTEKLRRKSPVTLDELYQLIDGMPMRKIEMKKARTP